jgi:hypothetical protein
MAPIDDAVAAIELLEPGQHFTYRAIARQFGVSHATLSRRHKGSQCPRKVKDHDQQLLSPQQEHELVEYITGLTKRGLPPMREMIRNFASQIASKSASDAWVTRFMSRNHEHLVR